MISWIIASSDAEGTPDKNYCFSGKKRTAVFLSQTKKKKKKIEIIICESIPETDANRRGITQKFWDFAKWEIGRKNLGVMLSNFFQRRCEKNDRGKNFLDGISY